MADERTQRSFRSNDMSGRTTAGGSSQAANDPLAELARLIGQNDPFGEFGRERMRPSETPAPAYASTSRDPYAEDARLRDEAYGQPISENHEAGCSTALDYPEYRPDTQGYDQESYPSGTPPYDDQAEDDYQDKPRRRWGVFAIAAVFALAVVGTAGAYGYRTVFGYVRSGPPPVIKADATPSKIIPPKKDAQSAKLINDRVSDRSEKLVSREEKPVDLAAAPAAPPSQQQNVADASATPVLGSGIVGPDPKKVHTIIIRPDQPFGSSAPTANPAPQASASPQAQPAPAVPPSPEPAPTAAVPAAPAPRPAVAQAAPPHHSEPVREARETRHQPRHEVRAVNVARNAPLSLSPDAPAPNHSRQTHIASLAPVATASARAASGGYAVQVSSRRSEAEAKAAVHRLQSKYEHVLGGHSVMVRRVDLGAKGVYYRAMVGPFASSADAGKVCSNLKKAGGSCFVQRI